MPGMDGLQATRLIKDDTQLHKQPAIVMVTAFGGEEVREEAERLGIDGFLVKPVTNSMLVDTMVTLFAPATEEIAQVAGDQHAVRLTGARILLAEDNDINQQIAIELLEGVGARMAVASNGRRSDRAYCCASRPATILFSWICKCPRWADTRPRRRFALTRALPDFRSLP